MSKEGPSEEYLRGWAAARAYYQHTNSVPPYPRGYYPEQTPPASVAEESETEDDD